MTTQALLLKFGSYAGALLSLAGVAGLWMALGGWTPVSSQQVEKSLRRIELHVAQSDADQYEGQVTDLIIRQGAIERDIRDHGETQSLTEEQARTIQELEKAKGNLDSARTQQKDLSK
jgi:hypothetical protein